MKTMQNNNFPTLHTFGPIFFPVVVAGGKSTQRKPEKEPEESKAPVEPISEKDEVKNAEEETRKAQESVDRKKTKKNTPDK